MNIPKLGDLYVIFNTNSSMIYIDTSFLIWKVMGDQYAIIEWKRLILCGWEHIDPNTVLVARNQTSAIRGVLE